jgi:phosphoserine phosphatase
MEDANFVPESERIAVFDNDGTLWTEQPLYIQALFSMDIVRELAPSHPEWKNEQPFKAVLEGDKEALVKTGEEGLLKIVMAAHAGLTEAEFAQRVRGWLAVAKHPTLNRPYTELVYQPMLELLAYLRENHFKIFIVSGGGVSFMRVFAEEVYGVPPERVIGSQMVIHYEYKDGKPVIVREGQPFFLNDKSAKPLAIQRVIGRRPVMAFGNSDGDLQMIEWTTAGEGARFGALVKHTDADREFLYDKDSSVGRLDEAEKRALKDGWLVVDMKRDWKQVFPPSKKADNTPSAEPN